MTDADVGSTASDPQGQDPTLSRDAEHSTYAPYEQSEAEKAIRPAPAPGVEQTLGQPSGGGESTSTEGA